MMRGEGTCVVSQLGERRGAPPRQFGVIDEGARSGHSALLRVGGRPWQDQSMDGIERRRVHLPFKVVRASVGR